MVEDDDGYLELELHSVPLPPEMNISSYTTIYSHLPFSHPLVHELDDKYKLYLLYKDQSAVLVEFNVYSDMSYYDGLTKCLAGGDCLRMIMISYEDDSLDTLTGPSKAADIFSTESHAEVIRDTVLMVMQLRPHNETLCL